MDHVLALRLQVSPDKALLPHPHKPPPSLNKQGVVITSEDYTRRRTEHQKEMDAKQAAKARAADCRQQHKLEADLHK